MESYNPGSDEYPIMSRVKISQVEGFFVRKSFTTYPLNTLIIDTADEGMGRVKIFDAEWQPKEIELPASLIAAMIDGGFPVKQEDDYES